MPLQRLDRSHPYAHLGGQGHHPSYQPSHAISFADVAERCGHDKLAVQTVYGVIVSCVHQRVAGGDPVALQLWPLCEFQCVNRRCQMFFDDRCCSDYGLQPAPQKPMHVVIERGTAAQQNPRSRNLRSPKHPPSRRVGGDGYDRGRKPHAKNAMNTERGTDRKGRTQPPPPIQVAWETEDEEVGQINRQRHGASSRANLRPDPYAPSKIARTPSQSPILSDIGNITTHTAANDHRQLEAVSKAQNSSPIGDEITEKLMSRDQTLAVVRMCRLLDVFAALDTRDSGAIKTHDLSVGLARHFGVDLGGHDAAQIVAFINGNSGDTMTRTDFVRAFLYYEMLSAPHFSIDVSDSQFEAGEQILGADQVHRELYILQTGTVCVERSGQHLHSYSTKGDMFGELGKIYRDRSEKIVRAESKSSALKVCLLLSNSTRTVMNSSGRQLRASQYNCTRTQSVDSTRSPGAWDDRNLRQGRIRARKDLERDQFIRLVPLFSSMPTHLLHLFASHLKLKTYSKGRTIVQEGDFSDTLHIIADGVVQLTTGSSTVDLMGKDSFGEHGLIFRDRCTFTVVPKVPTTVFELTHHDFDGCLAEYADYRMLFALLAEERRLQDLRKRGVPPVFRDLAPFLCDDLVSLTDADDRPRIVPAWQLRTLLQNILMDWSNSDIDWLLAGGPSQRELTHQLAFNEPKQVLE
eukprot:SAG31_NODE_3941_length_3733_cov_3.910292_2_plen_689_part_01